MLQRQKAAGLEAAAAAAGSSQIGSKRLTALLHFITDRYIVSCKQSMDGTISGCYVL